MDTMTAPRLGRGLDALIAGDDEPTNFNNSVRIDAIQQNPYQPRKQFDEDELAQLTESVKRHGILQPLVVRSTQTGYQLVAGERRLRAAQAAGHANVPVHIVEFDDQQIYEAALVENIQRTDLNPIEKALGFKDYLDRFSMSQDKLGAKLGIDRSSVTNLLGLLNLPAEVQDAVRLGQISLGHAKVLKGLADGPRQLALTKQIVLQNLSVRALEAIIKEQDAAPGEVAAREPALKIEKTAHVMSLENTLRQRLSTRVEIKVKAEDKGQIVIGFENNDEFERILGVLQQ